MHQVLEVGDLPVLPLLSQVFLAQNPLWVQARVVLEILALYLSLSQNFLGELISEFRILEVDQNLLVVNQEHFKSCLLCQEMTSLDLFDSTQADNFGVWLCLLQLLLKEKDCALLLVCPVRWVHLFKEYELIVSHANEALSIAEWIEDLARPFDNDLSRR